MRACWAFCLFFLALGGRGFGQAVDVGQTGQYDRRQTFAVFGDYSNDSSHIALGVAEKRKWLEAGFQYEFRLVDSPWVSWRYTAEFRPLSWESDPTAIETFHVASSPPIVVVFKPESVVPLCRPGSTTEIITEPSGPIVNTIVTTCSRQWTYVSGFSPFGMRLNFRPHRRLQPTASLTAGLLMSAKPIPVATAGSFNFTFEIGAGVEYYVRSKRSVRLEWMYQHFSNAYTAAENPGVDNGLIKVTYAFGR